MKTKDGMHHFHSGQYDDAHQAYGRYMECEDIRMAIEDGDFKDLGDVLDHVKKRGAVCLEESEKILGPRSFREISEIEVNETPPHVSNKEKIFALALLPSLILVLCILLFGFNAYDIIPVKQRPAAIVILISGGFASLMTLPGLFRALLLEIRRNKP